MRTRTKLIGIFLVIGLIGGQIYYFTTQYQSYKEELSVLNSQIVVEEKNLAQMEESLKRLPQTRQKITNTELEVVALIGRMPPYTSIAKDLSDMIKNLETSNFINIQINPKEVIRHEYEGHSMIERQYVLSYIAPFSESKAFVENLNRAYQLVNISSFITDNKPQVDQASKAAYEWLYGDQFNELVESTLNFSLFVSEEVEAEEAYDPSINMLINTESAFENLENLLQETGHLEASYNEGRALQLPERKNETLFKWQIKDGLISGDNYCFIGPSQKEEEIYLGLTSDEEIQMTLTLTQEGYSVLIEDSKGKSKKTKVEGRVKAPVLQIISEVPENLSAVPKVHIRLDNQTEEVMVVDIEGTMKGNLHIYNEVNEEVNRGMVKGNLIVR